MHPVNLLIRYAINKFEKTLNLFIRCAIIKFMQNIRGIHMDFRVYEDIEVILELLGMTI